MLFDLQCTNRVVRLHFVGGVRWVASGVAPFIPPNRFTILTRHLT